MSKLRQRFLQDLYNVTHTLTEPKITPILLGNFRMQGPTNESDHDIHTNMMPFQVGKEHISSKSSKSYSRPESGTCNVCSAPCSSCLHINQRLMGSKVDEYFGETSSENALSFSVNDGIPSNKIMHGETEQKSWSRNFVSGSSSNTSENVDCETSFRNSDLSATSEIVSVFAKVDDFKDHQSCVTEIADTKLSDFSMSNGGNMDFSSFPVSTTTTQENLMMAFLQTSPECLDVRCNFNESQNSSKRQRTKSQENLKELPLSVCMPADLSSQNSGLLETPLDTVGDAIDGLNAEGDLPPRGIDNSPSSGLSPEVLEENLCPRLHGELLKYPSGHVNSLSVETTSVNIHSNLAEDDLDVVEKNEGNDNSDMCLPNAKEISSEAHPMEECDDYDLVEHDVKVCDICGDAGREDLLAICCRCSDGAEHTYCMREMVDKVPLGDWLCEECKFDVEMKSRNQEIVVMVDGSEKINSTEPTNPESLNTYKRFEAKGLDDENRIHNDCPTTKTLGKRLSDDVEVSCLAKRCALEQDNGSPKMSTLPFISRNSSFKLDRLKAKPDQHSSSNSVAAPESGNFPSSASRLRNQGTFIKSNSFSSLNVKPKVNHLDDVVRQKQRSVRESASLDRKEGVSRSMSKSVSFKLPNISIPNLGEPKVKMSSPKFSHAPDTKGSKHTKDRNIFERKNSFQSERLPISNPGILATKNDKKLVSSSETNTLYSSRKFRDSKAVSSDSRSMLLSKSSSFAARRGSEQSIPQGEVKRQSSTSLFGVSSTNEDCSHVLKPYQGSLKVDSLSSYCFVEGPSSNSNEGHPDILARESINIGERAKDSATGRSKQSSMVGNRISCQKCKEIGCSAQSCSTDSPGSPSKHLKVGVDGKDKLKAAIEAAVLRKPGIYRKHRLSDQCNDVSPSNVNCEIASQVLLSDSGNRGNVATSAELKEEQMVQGRSNTDFCKQETVDDDVKQFPIISFEASSSRTAESYPFVPLEGLSLLTNVPSNVSEGTPTFFKRLAIPKNEYIWKGVFEVHRIGRIIDFFHGMQAHLSACASPKVLEAVNKFNYKVLLNEVPRLTTWPVQFQESGVRDDNIAIFFFAKDCASYEKSYKGLLHNMMKNDVALKGSFDGFELMIFPSNQLPEKFQRWNTLFFLWGVFRGKRANKRHVLGSDEQNFVSQSIPSAVMSFPVNNSPVLLVDKGVSAGSIEHLASEVKAPKLTSLSSSEALKGGYDGRNDPLQAEQPIDSGPNLRSFSVDQSSIAKSCGEMGDSSVLCDELRRTSLEGGVGSDDKREPESNVCVESAVRVYGFSESLQMPINCNAHLSRQHSSSSTTSCEIGSVGNIGEGNLLDKMSSVKYEASLKERLAHESPPGTGNQMCTKAVSDGTNQVKPGIAAEDIVVEEVSTREKEEKTDCYGRHHGANLNSCSEPSSQICGVTSSSAPTNGGGGALDGNDISAERYFFPVAPLPEEEDGLVRKLMTSNMSAPTEDQFQDTSPNLELALGAETKTLLHGAPTFLVGKEERNIIRNLCSPEAATKGEEDDVSASLSLSLSFPFPDEEQTGKSLSKSEQLLPEPGHVNTSLLLFGLEGQVENRRSTLHSGRNSASQGGDRFL